MSPAVWLETSDASPERLITFGPAVFEAYARLRYIPDPVRPQMSEADVELAEDHPTDIEQARTVLRALADQTQSTTSCYFCVWEGYSGSFLDPELTRGPLVALPHRRYVLFTGVLSEIASWEDAFGGGEPCPPPAFVWPADHRWCFASDVDPHWAGIGASTAAVESLIARTDVDLVRAWPEHVPPRYAS